MSDVKEILKEYKEISNRYYELTKEVEQIHKNNLRLAEEMLSKIKKAIIKEVFKKGKCFSGIWVYLDWADKTTGPHWQLNGLGEIRKPKKKEEFPGTISKKEQLDIKWVESRIMNRYFSYYEPYSELLLKELKIKI